MSEKPPLGCVIIPVTPFQQNCSIVWCTSTLQGAVVDPGGEIDKIIATAAKYGVTLTKILVTHGHLDHCGGVADLAATLGIPIEGPHREDIFWIDQLKQDGAKYGMTWCKPFVPDRWLDDGDSITIGNLTLGVRHCPGHTPGHVVFHHEGVKVAFVGDVLFQGSIGRTDFPRGDHATLINAITGRLWPMGDETAFVPGHGPMSTFGAERQTNPFVSDDVLGHS